MPSPDFPIWLYWEGEKPEWIKKCQDTVFKHVKNVHLIHPEEFDAIRTSDRDIDLSKLYVAHRADFIRAFLLNKYGGIWIDSDCIVMKSLQPIYKHLKNYDFIGYRERAGHVANNFMGACWESSIAREYYRKVCNILRSGQEIEWLTLGSYALTSTIDALNIPWYELDVEVVQPICWSDPEAFFHSANDDEHALKFNNNSFCYMLSGNMVNGVDREEPAKALLAKGTFFDFLIRKSLAS